MDSIRQWICSLFGAWEYHFCLLLSGNKFRWFWSHLALLDTLRFKFTFARINCFIFRLIRNNTLTSFVKQISHIFYVKISECFFLRNRSTAFLMLSIFACWQFHVSYSWYGGQSVLDGFWVKLWISCFA